MRRRCARRGTPCPCRLRRSTSTDDRLRCAVRCGRQTLPNRAGLATLPSHRDRGCLLDRLAQPAMLGLRPTTSRRPRTRLPATPHAARQVVRDNPETVAAHADNGRSSVFTLMQCLAQERARQCPLASYRARAAIEFFGNLLERKAGEKMPFDQLRQFRIALLQIIESRIEFERFSPPLWRRPHACVEK